MAEDTSTKAFIYKARFQNSLHVKAAQARYNEIGRLAEQKKQQEQDRLLRARIKKENEVRSKQNDQGDDTSPFQGQMRMTTDMKNLASLKAANNRLATDMKKNQSNIALIDKQLLKLSGTLYKLRSVHTRQLKESHNAAYPRQVEKLKRRIEQLRSKTSIGNMTNKHLRSGIDQGRLELRNLKEGLQNIQQDLSEKQHSLEHLKNEIASNSEDLEEAEIKSLALRNEMKCLNKNFRGKFDEHVAIFEKQYAEELAEERKYEIQLLDSPPSKNRRLNILDSTRTKKIGASSGNAMQKASNIFFGSSKHKGAFLKAARINRLDEIKNKVNSLEEAFEKMTRETGIEDTNELVDTIIDCDRQNFRVLTQLNELNRDIEEYEIENKNIRRAIRIAVAQERGRKKGRVVHIDRVRDRVLQTQKKVEEQKKALERRKECIQLLAPMLLKIFYNLGCDNLRIGIDNGVNEMNVMPFLGAIEQRVVDLANVCSNLNDRKERRNASGRLSRNTNKSGSSKDDPRGKHNSFFLTQSPTHFKEFTSPKPRNLPNIEDMSQLAQEVKANDLAANRELRGHAPSPIYSLNALKEEAIAAIKLQEANATRIAEAIERAALDTDEAEVGNISIGALSQRSERENKESKQSPQRHLGRTRRNNQINSTKRNTKRNSRRVGIGNYKHQ